ncbi:MAG TPA: DUF2934 domain-containing protein [Pseudorhizobium sp.]|jgi:hypothetical protein|nr:DUF2934 domain-containing protein [Pseudorhizobium sp.]
MEDQDREHRIRERAYEIWERQGKADGHHERHWQEASSEIDGENSVSSVDHRETASTSGLASGLQPGGTSPGGGRAPGADSMGARDKSGKGVSGPN